MEKDQHNTPKKRKVDDNEGSNSSIFSDFKVEKVLREDHRQKLITIQGSFGNPPRNGTDSVDASSSNSKSKSDPDADSERSVAVVILERNPFDSAHLQSYLHQTKTLETLKNDIYSTQDVFPTGLNADMKATVIHPATEKHIAKYSSHDPFVVHETPELYNAVTLPCLLSSKFSIQWVYNILEKKTESERIVVEDTDPEVGFVMLPDLKWDRKTMESLYLIVIVHKQGLKSIRDLRKKHLPLLKNILSKGQRAIEDQFFITPDKLRVYFHYQPSYYHLHIHFTHIRFEAPGSDVMRAHLLEDVIDNIQMDSEFYSKKTLSYVVNDSSELYRAYKEHGYFK